MDRVFFKKVKLTFNPAANILVHEEGRLEICDFGVAGIVQSKLDKRSTWIGTPHWMPPEMFSTRSGEAHKYGSEVSAYYSYFGPIFIANLMDLRSMYGHMDAPSTSLQPVIRLTLVCVKECRLAASLPE